MTTDKAYYLAKRKGANHSWWLARGKAAYEARRDAWYAEGKTARGTKRKRNYQFLTGFTPEQKKERQRAISREWARKHKK